MSLAPVELKLGEKFGRLTVMEKIRTGRGQNQWRCRCACGYAGEIRRAAELLKGNATQCYRCVRREQIVPPFGPATIS